MEKKRILLIEDDKITCTFLASSIMRWGFEVMVAADGKKGLAMAQSQKPDLILLDLKLPGMPGEEICRQIKKCRATKRIPIIMETAKVSDVDRVIGRVIGADCYLKKPYGSDQLREQINRLLDI
jgi:DNA-binding response OmpR family regulator